MLEYAYYIIYLSLTTQSEAVITEVSTFQVLELRTNPQQIHDANYLPPTNGIYVHTMPKLT